MKFLDARTVADRLATAPLMQALAAMFAEGCITPVRHAHAVDVPDGTTGTLLLMPSWRSGAYLGTKLVSVFPGNSALGLPAVASIYILMDANNGQPLAIMDGDTLTARRTAATSALAARYLARADSQTLLVVGSGRIARELALTHCQARPALQCVHIWSRSPDRAEQLADELRQYGLPASAAPDLATASHHADLISVATLSTEPLLQGEDIRPGTHIDLVGAFRAGMREADNDLVARARIVCDTRAGVLAEADDIRVPLAMGLIDESEIRELADLCRGTSVGRTSPEDITLFKSVGAALEDLAAAIAVYTASPPA